MAQTINLSDETENELPTVPVSAATIYYNETSLAGSYASVADMILLTLPEDSKHDFSQDTLASWLRIAKNIIDEELGQRFSLPLTAWSDTILWAQCEIATIGALRKRGVRSDDEALQLDKRESRVRRWLRKAKCGLITPDPELSNERLGTQAFRYRSRSGDRGWDTQGRAARSWRDR